MTTGKDLYAEMPRNQQIFHYERINQSHQPLVVAVDISGSMDHVEEGETKTNIKLAEEMINQIGQDPDLKDVYKSRADICVMTFADHVTTVQDWIPLSQYKGGITLSAQVTTAFHDVVKQSINAVRAMKDSYARTGIQCKRPQVFIITDGYSTDPQYNTSVVSEAKALCRKYVDGDKIAIHVILLPGGSTDDSRGLSSKVMHYKVNDCAYGLPAIKTFINASIVSFSSANPGGVATTTLPEEVKTTQPVKKQSDGTRTVTQDVEIWY